MPLAVRRLSHGPSNFQVDQIRPSILYGQLAPGYLWSDLAKTNGRGSGPLCLTGMDWKALVCPEQTVSVSTLHKKSGHRPVIRPLCSAEDQRTYPLLSKPDQASMKGSFCLATFIWSLYVAKMYTYTEIRVQRGYQISRIIEASSTQILGMADVGG